MRNADAEAWSDLERGEIGLWDVKLDALLARVLVVVCEPQIHVGFIRISSPKARYALYRGSTMIPRNARQQNSRDVGREQRVDDSALQPVGESAGLKRRHRALPLRLVVQLAGNHVAQEGHDQQRNRVVESLSLDQSDQPPDVRLDLGLGDLRVLLVNPAPLFKGKRLVIVLIRIHGDRYNGVALLALLELDDRRLRNGLRQRFTHRQVLLQHVDRFVQVAVLGLEVGHRARVPASLASVTQRLLALFLLPKQLVNVRNFAAQSFGRPNTSRFEW